MKTAEEILNDCEFDNRNIVLNSREYRNMIIEAMEEYASQSSDVSDEEIERWAYDEYEQAKKRGGTDYADAYHEGIIEGIKALRDGKIKKGE